jgi:large subunit ribosomal protein L25
MSEMVLVATPREQTGKGVARKLRREGLVPAVLYGVEDPTPLAVSRKEATRMLLREGGAHALIELKIGQKKKGVLLRDHQRHPVTGDLLHCDFYEVQKGHRVTVTVAIHVVGDTPQGVREQQGILQHQLHEVEMDCLPNEIPETIEVDASALQIGDSIHVADLAIPEGVRVHVAEDVTVVTVLAPRVAEEVEAEAEAEAGEEAPAEGGEPEAPAED